MSACTTVEAHLLQSRIIATSAAAKLTTFPEFYIVTTITASECTPIFFMAGGGGAQGAAGDPPNFTRMGQAAAASGAQSTQTHPAPE